MPERLYRVKFLHTTKQGDKDSTGGLSMRRGLGSVEVVASNVLRAVYAVDRLYFECEVLDCALIDNTQTNGVTNDIFTRSIEEQE